MITQMTNVQHVCQNIASPAFRTNLEQALPPNVSIDRFIRTALTGIQQNPAVCDADRQSLYLAIQRCAADGLLPDGRGLLRGTLRLRGPRNAPDVAVARRFRSDRGRAAAVQPRSAAPVLA
jgi:hypothetical protein